MLCIKAIVIAGAGHPKHPEGSRVAAVLFAAANDIDAAEELIAPVLGAAGWSKLETERWKDVGTAATLQDVLLRDAFQDALESGVGYVLYPENDK
jgi:hypothetical protein